MTRLKQWLLGDAVALSWAETHRSAFAALFGLGLTAVFSALLRGDPSLPILVTPIAASTVILFAIPHSPLAQPWSFVGGSALSAAVGLLSAVIVPDPVVAGVIAVPIAIWLMARLACLHPPAGAQALAFAMGGRVLMAQGWAHVAVPLALNLLGMLLAALLINNLMGGRPYPFRTQRRAAVVPAPARYGVGHADLHYALSRMETFVDVAEPDLVRLHALATQHAFQRATGLRCGDVMSTQVLSVVFASELDEAWAALQSHHFKALPVVDRGRRVIGIVTQADFIRHAQLHAGDGSAIQRLLRLLQRTPGLSSDKPEVVGQIMSPDVLTVAADAPLSEVMEVLSQRGKHHVPVIDSERRLVGMITQSDVLSAVMHRLAAAAPPVVSTPEETLVA